ncbi:MAG: NAD(P)H-hydrate dehydratase [Bacillota bacterium]|nr:NAD(P)H-hydrate dehydratase [Bacillota bacterium]MDI7248926.1 NAD(P)H-hydrate dehydratase [Bacillota bacterium]
MKAVTGAEMREIDRLAQEEAAIPGLILMENAGRAVFGQALRMLGGEPAGRRVLVLCGKGNNGGDGLVVARHLCHHGAEVRVLLAAMPEELKGDAAANLAMARAEEALPGARLAVRSLSGPGWEDALAEELAAADLVVDALLGTGIQGGARGQVAQVIEILNRAERPVLSVDVPSGLDADTGAVSGPCVRARVTVTLGLPKVGLLIYPGAEYAGRVLVADIGIPPGLVDRVDPQVEMLEEPQVAAWLPARPPAAHKGTFGHLWVVAGSQGMVGAAKMAAMAGLRGGAGLVTLALPARQQPVVAAGLSEVMTRGLPEEEGMLSASALDVLKEAGRGVEAWAIGPGLGRSPGVATLVRDFVRWCPAPLVIDADGLWALGSDLSLLRDREHPTVLTPHPGEMARLLDSTVASVQADRREAVREAARRARAVVVLKGARSLVGTPTGRVFINPTGNVGMATGGSGDVLTGLVGAFLAQGVPAERAACLGVFLHGLAGDLAAGRRGRLSLVAGDILTWLPQAARRLERLARNPAPG